jgi:uncharacterized protein (TIGR04255 family)
VQYDQTVNERPKTMPLPEVQRVIYRKNPLIEVVFQVRTPKYLPIEAELPAEFQKLVVKDYPIYEQRNVFQFVITAPSQEAGMLPSEVSGRMHAFTSADKIWSVILSGDGLVLSTREYQKWDDFKIRLRAALEAFLSVYPLPIFTRIGLRYQNVISRESLGLAQRQWRELLTPPIAGELAGGDLTEDEIVARQTVITLRLKDNDMMLVRHGFVSHKDTKALAYLIDGDFYNEEQRTADLNDTLNAAERLHANSGRLFRWCITDPLHTAMDPQPIAL